MPTLPQGMVLTSFWHPPLHMPIAGVDVAIVGGFTGHGLALVFLIGCALADQLL